MSESAGVHAVHGAHVHHEELGFWRTYVFSTDHKMIGRQFLFLGLFMLVIGGLLAMLMRWQLGWPETPVPGMRWVPEPYMFEGIIPPQTYNMLFTMHATIMIFFAVMPIMIGCFGNFLIPLMIGARDMAFPVLNMLSFWSGAMGGVVMLAGFFVPGGHAASGWTAYAPLSASAIYTGVDWGQNLWNISLIIIGASSLMGSINYITTIINMRAPGMTWFRLPLVIWSLFITAILLLLALPVLTAALAMLLADRMLGTHFFLPAGGGEPLLWQHLFWYFGHPEVYVLVLPAMGVTSDVLSTFSRKPIFGYRAMAMSLISIAFLSWIVWGHHMFLSGMNPALGTAFMMSTMVIAVPSAIKTFNWLGTLWGGSIRLTTPMLNALGFVAIFVIGGLSGVFMASTPVDIFIHDTYFIVAHLHYVLFASSLFGIFAGLYYWFPKMFGRCMNETWGKVHFFLTFVLGNCVFFPMHILGVAGLRRRIPDITATAFERPLLPLNQFITLCAILLGTVQIIFLVNFLVSLFRGKVAERNPWGSNTLEWIAPSPPPHGNFESTPVVYRWPYEYVETEQHGDHLPQTLKVEGPVPSAAGHH